MTFPTGSGSERLKYTKIAGLTDSDQTLITGVALHIYTIVSIIWCEQSDSTDLIRLTIYDSDGTSNPCYIIMNKSMSAYSTYVFNDRFSFDGDKKLRTRTVSGANIDVICTYIDQSWV